MAISDRFLKVSTPTNVGSAAAELGSISKEPSRSDAPGKRSPMVPENPDSGNNVIARCATRLPSLPYMDTNTSSFSEPVCTNVRMLVCVTFGNRSRSDGSTISSAPSTRLSCESKIRKKPVTAGLEVDSSTHPVLPEMPGPNISVAISALWLNAGIFGVSGFMIPAPWTMFPL